VSSHGEATAAKSKTTFEIKIVYGVNKRLEVSSDETIAEVKIAALGLFGIDESEAGNYHLQAKIDGEKDTPLEEDKTIGDYAIKKKMKVVLAAGAPFGAC
jgi:hypothetical protein